MYKIRKKATTWIIASILAAACLSGCGNQSAVQSSAGSDGQAAGAASEETSSLKVGVFDMASLYLMQTFNDMGYFSDHGCNVEFTYFPVYSDAISAFNSGNVDMICYAVSEGIAPVVNGIDCKVVGVMDTSDGLDGIAASSDINSVKDLKGKTVATEIGTVDHMMLLRKLEENNLGANDINLINMSAGDAVAALAGGSIDAVATWEPQLSMAAEYGKTIYTTEEDPDMITDVFLAHSDAVSEQQDNLETFLETWYDGVELYLEDPDEYNAEACKYGDLTEDEYKAMMDATNLVRLEDVPERFETGENDDKYLNVSIRKAADFLYENELIDKELTDDQISGMLDPSIIDKIVSE